MNNLSSKKQKTILVKRTGEKISIDTPYELVEKARMGADVIKIGDMHAIKCSAVNEIYVEYVDAPVTKEEIRARFY